MDYEDFEIVIEKIGGSDIFSVNVRKPCGGQIGDAGSSFTLAELEGLTKTLPIGAVDDSNSVSRHFKPVSNGQPKQYSLNYNDSLTDEQAKLFGDKLSDLLFRDDVLKLLGKCEIYCQTKGSALRIRLDLSRSPKLAEIPWEYLKTDNSNFACLTNDFTIVRYLQTAQGVRPLKVVPPLRILVMSATPKDLPQLAKNVEIKAISDALTNLNVNFVEIKVLAQSTQTALETALKEAKDNNTPFHIFHYIGHGAFEEKTQEGVLIFEDINQNSSPISHDELGMLLENYQADLRLVVLNACLGAKSSTTDSYASVAAKIMQKANLPAVIAMQYKITDSAAIIFAKHFYQQLAEGASLEDAIHEARLKITNQDEYDWLGKAKSEKSEWATPVLYLRTTDGKLFDLKIPTPPTTLNGHYLALKQLIPSCNLVVFLGLDVNLLNRPMYDSLVPGKVLPSASELCSIISSKLNISPPSNSLAGLAKILQLGDAYLPDEFIPFFNTIGKSSKLYRVLANVTKKVTEKLSETPEDPLHCSMLFVTTTYDFSLENSFKEVGITEYHTICYEKSEGQIWFTHNHFKNGKLETKTPLVAPNNPNEYKGLSNKYPVILKLPGEVTEGATFAITEDDFFALSHIPISELLPKEVMGQINTSRHLYLGYDLQNWTLRLLWNRICENQNPNKKESSYAVVFDKDDDPNAGFWKDNKVKLAPASLEDYVEGLEQLVLNQL